jgi:hypothetical protein
MNEEEINQLVALAEPVKSRAERIIKNRHYDVVVFKMVGDEKKIYWTHEYLTMRQARELKKDYLAEKNLFCDIIESVTVVGNGNELTFPERNPVPEIKGKGGFNTPTATDRIIERQRRAQRNKASFKNAHAKAVLKSINKMSRAERNSLAMEKMILQRAVGYDPKSSLHEMYVDNVKRNGYTVKDKITGREYQGLQNEIRDVILYLVNLGRKIKIDIDISFNGV